MKDRILALCLAVVLLVSAAPGFAARAEEEAFAIQDGVLLHYGGNAAEVVVPEGVTRIAAGAFYREDGGIYGNRILRSVVLPEGLTTIDRGAFRGCDVLERVQFPSTLRELSVTGNGYESGSFAACWSLKEIVLPEGLTEIGPDCFRQCEAVTSVTLPSTLKTIGADALSHLKSLRALTLPEGLETIGDGALSATPWEGSITALELPASVRTIGDGALAGLALTSIVIPDTVTGLGKGLFNACGNLKQATLPAWITEIGENMFSYSGLTSFTVPAGVTRIGPWAFSGCGDLETVALPEGLTEIGREAFYLCGALRDPVLPESLRTIGENAFYGCGGLTAVKLPAGVASVGDYAFGDCRTLVAVTVPEGGVELGRCAFAYCPALSDVTVPGRFAPRYTELFSDTPWVRRTLGEFIIEDGVLKDYLGAGGLVVVPEGVTEIGGRALWRPDITELRLPESLRRIDGYAFMTQGATNPRAPDRLDTLVRVYIPAGVEHVGEGAFYDWVDPWYCGDRPAEMARSLPEGHIPTHAKGWEDYRDWPAWDPAYAVATTIRIDGKPVDFDAYAIKDGAGNDTTYLKLRDVADVLNGTAAQFNVGWDGAIALTTGVPYTDRNGTEGAAPFAGNHAYTAGAGTVQVNGIGQALDAITLTDNAGGGYTYFKLRDLGAALGFDVIWSGSAIEIRTDQPYSGAN